MVPHLVDVPRAVGRAEHQDLWRGVSAVGGEEERRRDERRREAEKLRRREAERRQSWVRVSGLQWTTGQPGEAPHYWPLVGGAPLSNGRPPPSPGSDKLLKAV